MRTSDDQDHRPAFRWGKTKYRNGDNHFDGDPLPDQSGVNMAFRYEGEDWPNVR
jgi:hypothetical protein